MIETEELQKVNGNVNGTAGVGVNGYSAADDVRKGLVGAGVAGASSVSGAVDPKLYIGTTRAVFNQLRVNRNANVDLVRPMGIPKDDERWLANVNTAQELLRAEDNANLLLLVDAGKRMASHLMPGQNRDELRYENFDPEECRHFGMFARNYFYPNLNEEQVRKFTETANDEELGKKIIANVAMHVRSPEEISRFFDDKELSDEDAAEYAENFREMYGIHELAPKNKEDAKRYCMYYLQTRNAFYGFIAARCKDESEIKDAWALSLVSDSAELERMTLSLMEGDGKSWERGARVIRAADAVRAYSNANVATAAGGGFWNGVVGAVRGIYEGSRKWWDSDYFKDEENKNWWAFVNKKIAAKRGELGSREEALKYIEENLPLWSSEFERNNTENSIIDALNLVNAIAGSRLGATAGIQSHGGLFHQSLSTSIEESEEKRNAKLTAEDYLRMYEEADKARRREFAIEQANALGDENFAPEAWARRFAQGSGQVVGYMFPYAAQAVITRRIPMGGIKRGVSAVTNGLTAYAMYRDEMLKTYASSGDVTTSESERQLAANLYGCVGIAAMSIGLEGATRGAFLAGKKVLSSIGLVSAESAGVSFAKRGLGVWLSDAVNLETRQFAAKYGNGLMSRGAQFTARFIVREGLNAGIEGLEEGLEEALKAAAMTWVNEDARDFSGAELLDKDAIVSSILESMRDGALYSFGMRGFYGLPGFVRGARELGRRTIAEDGTRTGDRVLSANMEAIVRTVGMDEAFRARIGGLLPKAKEGSSEARVVKTVRELLNAETEDARAKIRESEDWAKLTEAQKRKAEELAEYFDRSGESGKAIIEAALIDEGVGRYGGHGYTEKELTEARGILENEFERNALMVQLREDEARLAELEAEFRTRQYEEAGSESAGGAVPRGEREFGLLTDDELWLERKLGATEIEKTKAKLEENSAKIKRSLGELRRTEEDIVRGFTGLEGFVGDSDSAKDLRNRLRAEYAALKKAGVESSIHKLTAKLAGFDLESGEEETKNTRERARLKAEAEKAAKAAEEAAAAATKAAEEAERAAAEAAAEERRAANASEREKNAEYAAELEAEAERKRAEARAAAEAAAEAEARRAEAARVAEETKRAEEAAVAASFDSERLEARLKEREAAAKELISLAENHGLDDEALAKFAVLKGLADNEEEAGMLVKLYRAGAVLTPEGIAGLAGAPMETVNAILRMAADLGKLGKESQEAFGWALKAMADSGWEMHPSVAAVQLGNVWEKTFLLHLSRGDLVGLENFVKMNARLRESILPRRGGLFTPTPFEEVDEVRIAYAAAALSFPESADNSMREDAMRLLEMTAAYPGAKLLDRLFNVDLNKKRLGWDLVTETAAAGDVEAQDAANSRSADFAGESAAGAAEKIVKAAKKKNGDAAATKMVGEATVKPAKVNPGESRAFSPTPSALVTEGSGKNAKAVSARSFTGRAPYLIAGNKSAVIANNSALFRRIGEYAAKTGGRIFDLFGGSNIYFYSLDALGALPKGHHLWNEWSTVRYVVNCQIKDNPEGVIAALDSLVKRFLASEEWAEYKRRIEAFNRKEAPWYKVLENGDVQIGGNAQMVLVDWLRDELNGKHAGSASYLSKPGEDTYGVFLKNDARSAALYLFVQNHATDNRPIGTIWKNGQAVFSHPPVGTGGVAEIGTGDITSFRRTKGGKGAGKTAVAALNTVYEEKNGEREIARKIREASRVLREGGIEISQGDGWAAARMARRGDVVFIDPSYIGTQGYSKDNADDSNPAVFLEKAKALIEYGNANGVTYIFTNEYDLSGARGEANFDELYGKLARLTNKDGTPMVSVNRTVRSGGKAEIMIVNDGGAFLLNPSKTDVEIIREKNPAMSVGEAVKRAQEAKLENGGLTKAEDLAWAQEWQKKQLTSVLMQRALSVFTEAGARRIEAQVRKFGGWLGRAGVKVRIASEAEMKAALEADKAFRELMDGRSPNYGRVLWQMVRAYHGSPHRFAEESEAQYGRFRDEKMGSGEGVQAFGWGHYLTSVVDIAKDYATKLARDKKRSVLKTEEVLRAEAAAVERVNAAFVKLEGVDKADDSVKEEPFVRDYLIEKVVDFVRSKLKGKGSAKKFNENISAYISEGIIQTREQIEVDERELARLEKRIAKLEKRIESGETTDDKSGLSLDELLSSAKKDVEVIMLFFGGQKTTLKRLESIDKIFNGKLGGELITEELATAVREWAKIEPRNLYTVEFEDSTLLDWTKGIPRDVFEAFLRELRSVGENRLASKIEKEFVAIDSSAIKEAYEAEVEYNRLEEELSSTRDKFLKQVTDAKEILEQKQSKIEDSLTKKYGNFSIYEIIATRATSEEKATFYEVSGSLMAAICAKSIFDGLNGTVSQIDFVLSKMKENGGGRDFILLVEEYYALKKSYESARRKAEELRRTEVGDPLSKLHNMVLGTPKDVVVSKALWRAGVIGHKFPSRSMGRGNYSQGTNYVIYNGGDVEITDVKRWMKDGETGEAFGWYDTNNREVVVSAGARGDTLLHELGWHATYSWARENAPELHAKMREYAESAPEELKRAVADAYGHENGEISDEEFLDECGAAFFSEENAAKVEAAIDAETDGTLRGKMRRAWNAFRELLFKLWTRMDGTYERYWTEDGKRKVNLDEILDASKSVREQMSALADSFAKGQLLADYAEAKESVESGSTAVGDALAWAGRNRGSAFANSVNADVSDIRNGRRYQRPLERVERDSNRAAATSERIVNSPDMEAFASRYEALFRRLGMSEDLVNEGKNFQAHLFENIKASAEAVYTARGIRAKSALRLQETAARKSGANMSKAVNGLMRAYELPVLGSEAGGVIGWGRNVAAKLDGQTSDKALGLEALKRVLAAHYHRWAVRVLSSASAIKAEESIERLDAAKDVESVLSIADRLEELLSKNTDKATEAELRKGAKRMLEKYGRFYESRELTERKYEGGAERFLHLLAKYERLRASNNWEAEFEKRRTAYEGVLAHPGTTRVQKLEALAGMAALAYWWAKPMRDMSAAELIALTEKISEVETDGALAKRSAEVERESKLKEAWGKVEEAIKQSAAKKGGNPNNNAGWIRSGLNFGQSLRSKLESAIRFADKGTYEEAMEAIRQIDLLITEANNTAAAKVADDEYEFFAALLRYAGKENKISQERHGLAYIGMSRAAGNVIVELMGKAKGGEKFSADGKEKRTWLELMAQWLMMNQREWADMFAGKEESEIPEGSKAAWRKWKQQEELAEFLGEGRVNLAQAVSKILQARAEEIDAQSVKDTGVGLSYRRGDGYFPIVHEMNSYMSGLRVHASGGVPSVVPKILTPRKHSRKDIDEHADLLSVFRRQIFDVAQYTAFGETGAGQVLRGIMEDDAYADMRKNVAGVLGANLANSVWRHMAQVLSGRMEGETLYDERDAYGKFFGVMRWVTRCLGLAYNLVSGAKQVVGGIPAYVNAYGFRNTLLAVLKRPLPSIETFRELLKSDGYVQRYGNNEMTRMLAEVRLSGGFISPRLAKMFMRAENNSMMFTAYGDRVPMFLVGTAIYTAMKNEYIAQGKTVEEATRLAQRDFWQVQDRTQQARHIQNADQISREKGDVMKTFVQFLTSPIQFVSDEIHAWEMAIARKDAAALRKLATVTFHNHVLQAGAMYLVNLAVRALLGDDDEDWLTKRDVSMFILGSWEAIPVFGSAFEATMLMAAGENTYGSTMFAPSATETGTRVVQRVGKLIQTLTDGKDGSSTKAAMKLAESSAAIRYMHKTWNKYIADEEE